MNRSNIILCLCLLMILIPYDMKAQSTQKLSFDEVLSLARSQSPRAVMARHQFRSSYWAFRSYQAGYLPLLSMSATIPDLNRSYERIQIQGGEIFDERKQISFSSALALSQNVPLTGGRVSVNTDLQRIDKLGPDGETTYLSTPIDIVFNQPINGYNSMRWQRLIEPLKYEEAKKTYLNALEGVSIRAVNYFFDLLLAQKNVELALLNFANADTLYKIAAGRYQLGTIAENELLQMQLSYLRANTELNSAQIDLNVKKFQLNSFLGLQQDLNIELVIPNSIPDVEIPLSRALEEAKKNNPEVIAYKRQLLEADQRVAQARGDRGLSATLYARLGLSQKAADFEGVYMDPNDMERVRVGLNIPIMDWGQGRGRYKMAQSAQELTRTNVRQAEMDFEQEVLLQVMQFNLQDDQLRIAAKADTIGQNRYEVSKQRFLIGKISVLDLKDANQEKDLATRSYIAALKNYWTYFFNLRSLTLFDWISNRTLSEEFEELVK